MTANRTMQKETEYMYCSARIRCMETRLVSADRFTRLLEMKTVDEAIHALADAGTLTRKPANGESVEDVLLATLADTYREVGATLPDASLTRFLQYPFDCHNIKSIIKCHGRGVDPRRMLVSCGTADAETAIAFVGSLYGNEAEKAMRESPFAPQMTQAAHAAALAFARTRVAGEVDRVLDQACFADMAAWAEETAMPCVKELLATRADMTNVLTALRLSRKGCAESIKEFLLAGGVLSADTLCQAVRDKNAEEALLLAAEKAGYDDFAKEVRAKTVSALSVWEAAADNTQIRQLRKVKMIPFGPQVPLAYLAAKEMEIKNLRILLSGKAAGLENGTIRERMRELYV